MRRAEAATLGICLTLGYCDTDQVQPSATIVRGMSGLPMPLYIRYVLESRAPSHPFSCFADPNVLLHNRCRSEEKGAKDGCVGGSPEKSGRVGAETERKEDGADRLSLGKQTVHCPGRIFTKWREFRRLNDGHRHIIKVTQDRHKPGRWRL
jgi:hypothetical protein